MLISSTYHSQWGIIRCLVTTLAALILFFGLFFVILGAQLAWLGGSYYYVITGIILITAGILMIKGHILGNWLYLLAWFFTIPWTIYEVGFNFWGWLPRLLGPTLIAIAVAINLLHLYRQTKASKNA